MIPKARVKKIEAVAHKRTGGKDESVIVVTWGDDPEQLVHVRGEDMTLAECERCYPDALRINVIEEDPQ